MKLSTPSKQLGNNDSEVMDEFTAVKILKDRSKSLVLPYDEGELAVEWDVRGVGITLRTRF